MQRRTFLRTAAMSAAAGSLMASSALAKQVPDPKGWAVPPRDWNESITLYPDPAFEVFDHRFDKYNAGTAPLLRVFTGARWTEGPVYFGDQHCVIFSDIPNNRLMRYDEVSGQTTLFRDWAGNPNGNTRDWQGRLLTCEHSGRRVSRTEYTGEITVIADNYQGKKLNSPNGVVVKKDDTIWFTDPTYGIMGDNEGVREAPELPHNVYMVDPKTGKITVVVDDLDQPNGLCFSPDEKLFYVTDTGKKPIIRVYDCSSDNKLSNGRLLHEYAEGGGLSDDIRCDEDGNIWSAGAWATNPYFSGVSVYAPDGTPLGRIVLPENAANLCFGGYHHQHSYLYITAGRSLYVMPVHTRGVEL
jgi:gluconolactonase